jgi:uncharacterized protein (DUF305 family)
MKLQSLVMSLMVVALPAVAAEHGAHHGHGSHGATADSAAATVPSTLELQQANATMHKDMDIAYTGDADIDFLRGMIAHHQGAVEMARVQLRYGRDAKVTRLAEEIIRAQNLEIAWMQKWLTQLEAQPRKPIVTEPRRGMWNDSNWNGRSWLGER